MATINDLVQEALAGLRGYVRNQEQVTYLVSQINSTATTLTVGNGSRVSPGRIAVNDEIMEVDSVSGNSVTLFPFGRGSDGSTAETQAANSRVVSNPLFPRFTVLNAVRTSVQSVHEQVPGIAQTTLQYDSTRYGWSLPANVETVLSVQSERPGLLGTWIRVDHYRVEKNADTTDFASGNFLNIYDGAFPGRDVLVTYTKTTPTASGLTGSTNIVSGLGMPETVRDVIVMGAVARLLSMVDIATLDASSVQALFVDEKRQPGSGGRVVQQLWSLYRQRLEEERLRFLHANPIHIHYER